MSNEQRKEQGRRKGDCRRKESIPVEQERRKASDRRTGQDRRKK